MEDEGDDIDYTSNPLLLGELIEGDWNSDASDRGEGEEGDEEEAEIESSRSNGSKNGIKSGRNSSKNSEENEDDEPPSSSDGPVPLKKPNWTPFGTQFGGMKFVPAPPTEKNKLTPLAASKVLSKSDSGALAKALPKTGSLEKQLEMNKSLPLSPVFNLDNKVLTPKSNFGSSLVLPPIPIPEKSADQSGPKPASETTNEREHSHRDENRDSPEDKEGKKQRREIEKLYKKCKEKNEYRKFHEHVEKIFTSFTSIASYFENKAGIKEEKYDESCGLDLKLLYTTCDLIDRFPLEDTLRKIVLKSIVDILMSPPSEKMDKSHLQAYFAMMHLPIFSEINTYVVYSYLIKQVSSFKGQFTHELMIFFNKAGAQSITTCSKMLKRFIDRRFFPPNPDSLPPSGECQWWIPQACKALSILYAGSSSANRLPHVSFKHFYCKAMDYLELLEDFQSWSTGVPKRSFTFCQYPFLMSTFAKRKLLTEATQMEMMKNAKKNLETKIKNKEEPRVSMMFVDFKVRRSNLVQDSMKQIVQNQKDLKRKLRVVFEGEEGVDLGGLTKEWFMLVTRKVFTPDFGLFVKKPSRCLWFNGGAKNQSAEFYLVGALMGLAIYNSVILDIRLPKCCYRKLLSPPLKPPPNSNVQVGFVNFTLHDLAELEPEVAKHLKELLEYEGDVENDYGLDFTLVLTENDKQKAYTLKKNGPKIKVTNQNKKEYVSRYISFHLNHYVFDQFESFYKGFHSVCDSEVLQLLRAEELEAIICGEPVLDVKSLRKCTTYEGYTSKDDLIKDFWEVVGGMRARQQGRLLGFVTGCDKFPIGGSKDLQIKIKKVECKANPLPVAQTCFNELWLPTYKNKQILKEKLIFAIDNTEGFSLE